MEICTCLVSIGGDPRHVVPKHSTTPAEIVLLQRLHGNDAVTEIVVTEKDKRSHEDERDRLALDMATIRLWRHSGSMAICQLPGCA